MEKLKDPDLYREDFSLRKGDGVNWPLRDDFMLYELKYNHNESIESLANRFNRTESAIRGRLSSLDNEEQTGHKRLMKQYGIIDFDNWNMKRWILSYYNQIQSRLED